MRKAILSVAFGAVTVAAMIGMPAEAAQAAIKYSAVRW